MFLMPIVDFAPAPPPPSLPPCFSPSHYSYSTSPIPRILWNSTTHSVLTTARRLFLLLKQMNPVDTLPLYFLNISFNNILPSTSRSPKWPSLFAFPHHSTRTLPCIPLPCPSHVLWFGLPNNIWSFWLRNFLLIFTFLNFRLNVSPRLTSTPYLFRRHGTDKHRLHSQMKTILRCHYQSFHFSSETFFSPHTVALFIYCTT